MSFAEVRIRGGGRVNLGPWPVGAIPKKVLMSIGKQLVHRLAIGQRDISGDDFGTIFAKSIGGRHMSRPLGLADVVKNGTAWSVKTVKHKAPRSLRTVRLISGRCSPDYSMGISNPREDPQKTGSAVLKIWNSRYNASIEKRDELRIVVLIRNMTARDFVLFEHVASPFSVDDYVWTVNSRKNFEGHDKTTADHCFTWQPHGSQLTVIRHVPGSARKFAINHPVARLTESDVLEKIGYEPSWISIG